MIRLIDTTKTHPFTLESDTEEPKTIFHISPLTSHELHSINTATVKEESLGGVWKSSINTSLRNRLSVQLKLRGWENGPQQFETEKRTILGITVENCIKEELLNKLPIDYVNAIGQEIQRISLGEGNDVKN